MAIKQEVNSALIITVGIVSALLLVVIIIGLQAWFVYEEHAEVQSKWAQAKNVELQRIVAQERANIERRGATTIPVTEAMKLVAQRRGKVNLAPATQTTQPPPAPGQPATREQPRR